MHEQGDLLHTAQQTKEKIRQLFAQRLELLRPPPFLGQIVAVVARATQALGGQAFAMLQHLFALAADAARTFLGFGWNANAGERLGVAGNISIQARNQGQCIASVGLHLLAVLIPIARTHDEVFDAQTNQAAVQYEAKRSGFVS